MPRKIDLIERSTGAVTLRKNEGATLPTGATVPIMKEDDDCKKKKKMHIENIVSVRIRLTVRSGRAIRIKYQRQDRMTTIM
jgi:hypothetical protein